MKVSELEGAWLDYFVAKAEGHEWRCSWMLEKDGMQAWQSYEHAWGNPTPPYSSDWEFGGPLLQKHELGCAFDRRGVWLAVRATGPNYDTSLWSMLRSEGQETEGSTALEAICRAVVRAKFGDEIEP